MEAREGSKLVAASYEYESGVALEDAVRDVPTQFGTVDTELSTKNVLVFHNAETGETTLGIRGTVRRGEWGFDARTIALQAAEEESPFFHRTYYDLARRVTAKYGAKPVAAYGHSLGGNAAIRLADRGLVERSVTLNPFVRPSSIGDAPHAIYRTGDDPALLSFEALTRSERGGVIDSAGTSTELHVIPRSSVRSVVDPVHAHSLDRFIEGEVATEATPLLGQAAVRGEQTLVARATRAGKSLATGAGGLVAGAGAGALTGVVLEGYGIKDQNVQTVAGGAVGGLAQEALFGAVGVGTMAEGAAALGAGAAGGLGFVGGYEATKALGGNETVSTVVGVASGTALQAAAAESIGIAAEAAVGAAAGAVEAGAVALGLEGLATGLGAFAAADFWNPLGWVAGALAVSAVIAGGVIGAVEAGRGGE